MDAPPGARMSLGRFVLLASLILVPLAGCKKKKVVADDEDRIELPPPSVKLQVAGVDPAFAPAGHSFDAEVLGSGFERGATVSFSGAAAETVRFLDDNSLKVAVPPMPAGAYDVTVLNPDGTKATLRKGLTLTDEAPTGPACRAVTVRFDLDSSVLTPETRRQLDTFAGCVRQVAADVRIEGHCDELGTTEYNLALGQRRAESVQRYLVGLGVSPNRVRVVSYGEERPVDRSGTASAHAANRRAEVLLP